MNCILVRYFISDMYLIFSSLAAHFAESARRLDDSDEDEGRDAGNDDVELRARPEPTSVLVVLVSTRLGHNYRGDRLKVLLDHINIRDVLYSGSIGCVNSCSG